MKNNFRIGQEVLYKIEDFDGKQNVKAVITESHTNYAIATTDDGIKLWIDEDTEMNFFDIDMINNMDRR